jgi:hypothetical protein
MTLRGIPLNLVDVPQEKLNIEQRVRASPLPWKGQFSPQFVEVLLATYAEPHMTILDPFAGSGTVLYECGRLGLAGYAVELNPGAMLLSRVYELINVDQRERLAAIHAVTSLLQTITARGVQIFGAVDPIWGETEHSRLLSAYRDSASSEQIMLGALLLLSGMGSDAFTPKSLFSNWSKLRQTCLALPHSAEPLRVINADARHIPLPEHGIDLVLTSPPYINVFNYHQQYRSAVEFLGWDVLSMAKSEIGSNRKHRQNRFLTAVQYCLDLIDTLREISRLARPGCRVIMILGRESTVLGVKIANGELVARLAAIAGGMQVTLRQERVFTNRYGERIVEDILHLESPQAFPPNATAKALEVGVATLKDLLPTASAEAANLIAEAVEQSAHIRSSPTYLPR